MLNLLTCLSKAANLPLKRFRKNEDGVAALEFAIISPILILLMLGTIEVSLAIAVDRKVSRASSAIADLITQHDQTDLDTNFLEAVAEISEQIIEPYETDLSIVLTGVNIDGNGNPTVRWSWSNGNGTPRTTGSPTAVPDSIRIPGTYLVSAQVESEYERAFKLITFENGRLSRSTTPITLSEEMFLRPRLVAEQNCTDC